MNDSMRSVTARLFASAHDVEESARHQYREADLRSGYWAMLDLRSSASFRLQAGDLESFVRLRVFSQLIAELTAPYDGMSVFKELGDGVLLRAEGFRGLVEVLTVLDGVTCYWNTDSVDNRLYPSLASRAAITFGDSFHFKGDYFGSPIDRVARLAFVPIEGSAIATVSDEVRQKNEARLAQELPFVTFDDPRPVPMSYLKSGETPFLISTLRIDRVAFGDFRDYFTQIRTVNSIAGIV